MLLGKANTLDLVQRYRVGGSLYKYENVENFF